MLRNIEFFTQFSLVTLTEINNASCFFCFFCFEYFFVASFCFVSYCFFDFDLFIFLSSVSVVHHEITDMIGINQSKVLLEESTNYLNFHHLNLIEVENKLNFN